MLSGAGLIFLTTRWRVWAGRLGFGVAALGVLTLMEYVTGRNYGIDQLLYEPYFEEATMFPGRMSPLTASCFGFLGTGLFLAAVRQSMNRRLAAAGMLTCALMVIALVVLAGYLFGIDTAAGWGAYSRMAVNTAAVFLVCAGGLFVWTWRSAREEYPTFLRWLPGTGSVTLLAMVALIASANRAQLNDAIYWRQHTFNVILSAQAFLDNILDVQRGLRGYVTLGDTNALAAYRHSLNLIPQGFAQLTAQTQDNPKQLALLDQLKAAVQSQLDFNKQVLAVYAKEGFAGVSRLDETGQGRMRMGQTRDLLGQFAAEEKRLLAIRGDAEASDYAVSTRLLVFGCVAAGILMFVGNFTASRQMRLRLRAEASLRTALTLQNAILASSSYAIVAMDRHGVVKRFSAAAEKMLGYAAAEVVDQNPPKLWSAIKAADASAAADEVEAWLPKSGLHGLGESEARLTRKDGQQFSALVSVTELADADGGAAGFLVVMGDISERKLRESEREKLIGELQEALARVKTLTGLIPICAWCKSVRSDKGYWQTVEQYVHSKTDASFTHGICPHCEEKMMAKTRQRPSPAAGLQSA